MRPRAIAAILSFALLGSTFAAAKNQREKDLRNAARQYKEAQESLFRGNMDAAIKSADKAVDLAPSDVRYVSYAALLRQMRSSRDLAQSRQLSRLGKTQESAQLLKSALANDPDNPELAAAARTTGLALLNHSLPTLIANDPSYESGPELQPTDPLAKREFHLRGNSGQVLTQFMQQYGISLQLDPNLQSRTIRFDARDVDYPNALGVLLHQAHAFIVPASAKQAIAYNDTPENRNNNEHLAFQTFDIGKVGDQQALNEVINALRGVFSLRFIGQTADGKLAIKAPRAQIEEAERFLEEASNARPELLLDINEIEVSDTLVRDLGITLPLQYQVLNVDTILQQAGVSSFSDLVSQLNAGTLSAASQQALSGILTQLQSENAGLAAFGGGKTQEAIIVPPATLHYNDQKNKSRILEHISLRALDGTATTYHDGLRYPVVSTTFTTLIDSSTVNQIFGKQNVQIPPPAVTYVDLGISLKFTPVVRDSGNLRLKFELQLKTLTGQTVNDSPVLGDREFSGTIDLHEGDTAIVAGLTEQSRTKSSLGIPGLSYVGLAAIGGSSTKNVQDSEILITVTPHSLRYPHSQVAGASASEKSAVNFR